MPAQVSACGGGREGRMAHTAMALGGLPPAALDLGSLDAVLFDLDGVLTDTASLHFTAWTEVFNSFFRTRAAQGEAPAVFGVSDYVRLVDGQLRLDGVRNVLADRNLVIEAGHSDDAPGDASVWAIANAKEKRFAELLEREGPRPFVSSIDLVNRLRAAGILVGVVSASHHCGDILAAADIADLFDAVVDGRAAAAMTLVGKPAPDTFLEATHRLGTSPARTAIFEDAASGVAAGRRGNFALVVGVNRREVASDLKGAGADIVVGDLGEVMLRGLGPAADGWHLLDEGSDPEHEGVREALYGLGNGYLATRGARTYAKDDSIHYPGTYFAGVYDRLASSIAGTMVEEEAIVNAPNWLPLTFGADDGSVIGTEGVKVLGHRVRLDLRRGLLERRYEVTDGEKRTSVLERRIVSMADPHLAALEVTLIPENWSGTITVRAGLDGTVTDSETVEERLLTNRHLEIIATGEEPSTGFWLAARTLQSRIVLAEAARVHIAGVQTQRRHVSTETSVAHHFLAQVAEQGRVTIEKVVAFHTSRDHAISEPIAAARAAACRAPTFEELLTEHVEAWERLWCRADVELDDEHHEVQAIIRFHLFHVLQVTSPHVEAHDGGIPARGLHGEGYLGHIFWDELFVFPLLNLRFPDVARALLAYRSRRLGAARGAAADAHHDGAMYPWQSGSDGRDETPQVLFNARSDRWVPDRSRYQRHVGLAVAYNVWQYWQATADHRYLIDHGAEVVLEVARHFASLAIFDESLERFRIRGVMGPDEFHDGYPWSDKPGVDDNAYTNVMTAWLLARSIELADFLERSGNQELLERVGCTEAELARFDRLSRRLFVPFVPFSDGVMAQFDGFERLEPIDLEAYRVRYGNIGRLDLILEAEGDTVRRYQVAKQPDTLMLLYLLSAEELRAVLERLGYALSPGAIRRTVQYYEARVTHGSSLSEVVHAWVAARVDRPSSWRHFTQAISLDLHDTQGGTTREGIHLGAMAGTVDLLERCYSGLEIRADALWLNPCLPEELGRLSLVLVYRGHCLSVDIDQHEVRIGVEGMPTVPATILIQGEPHLLQPGSRIVQTLK